MRSQKGIITVENLYCDILSNINFSVEPNTFTALIGKNGSGKTQLLKCIAGIAKYSGDVWIKGNVIKKSPVLDKNIGIYLGTVNLSGGTVFSNLLEPLINLGVSTDRAKKKVYEITKKISIDKILYKKIETLSYGEKKVVAFAKSIIHTPDILLLDNLFDSLDTSYKNAIIKYLKSRKQEKDFSVIFTTNDSENLMLADDIIILNKGKMVVKDSCKELFKDDTIFIKSKLKTPFVIDLSNKLKSYGLIDDLVYSIPDMVGVLWK